jgi:hypothetical protein
LWRDREKQLFDRGKTVHQPQIGVALADASPPFLPGSPRRVFYHYRKIIRTDVVKLADVGMIQRGHSVGFALEAFAELFGGNLDGDGSVEALQDVIAVDVALDALERLKSGPDCGGKITGLRQSAGEPGLSGRAGRLEPTLVK